MIDPNYPHGFFEEIQNAIAVELRRGGSVEGNDLAEAGKMALLAFARLSQSDRVQLLAYVEQKYVVDCISSCIPEWSKKFLGYQ